MGWDNERFANSSVVPADGSIDLGTSAKPFDDVYADRFHGNGAAVTAVDHGSTTGRTDDDHSIYHNDARGDARYYTQAQVTTISGDIVNQIPTSYISDAEMTVISGDLAGALTSHQSSADHDGRYYTEAEIATISGDITAQLTFLNLTDTPASYTDQDNKYVMVSGTQLVFATVSGGAGTDHSTLANLAYADAGHTGFLSSAQFVTSSGDIVAQFPTDFYSQAEITTISGDIVAQIPDTDDYATDAEVATISGDIIAQIPSLSGYATEAYVTTVSGDIVAQIPTDYISDAEMTVISGDLVAQIPSLAGYATDAEVTTISGDIVAQIPTVAGVTGWFDDGNNYRVYVANGLITAISGSVDGGYNVE